MSKKQCREKQYVFVFGTTKFILSFTVTARRKPIVSVWVSSFSSLLPLYPSYASLLLLSFLFILLFPLSFPFSYTSFPVHFLPFLSQSSSPTKYFSLSPFYFHLLLSLSLLHISLSPLLAFFFLTHSPPTSDNFSSFSSPSSQSLFFSLCLTYSFFLFPRIPFSYS